MRRGIFLFGLGAAFTNALMFAACGLDESGLLSDARIDVTIEGGATDAPNDNFIGPDVIQDTFVPPTCADASCLTYVPDGWVPLGAIVDPVAPCPGNMEDYESRDWVTDPVFHAGACGCSTCTPMGTWQCGGSVTVSAGTGLCTALNGSDTFDASLHCSEISASSTGGTVVTVVSGSTPAVTGTPTCSTTLNGNQQIDTRPVRTCRPQRCSTDYCGLKNFGFHLCILYNGQAACPNGFNPLPFANAGAITSDANVGGACETCGCAVNAPTGKCTATLRVYEEAGCDNDSGGTTGLDYEGQYNLTGDGGCQNNIFRDINSVYYTPGTPPAVTCSNNDGGSGTGVLLGANTVCCQ